VAVSGAAISVSSGVFARRKTNKFAAEMKSIRQNACCLARFSFNFFSFSSLDPRQRDAREEESNCEQSRPVQYKVEEGDSSLPGQSERERKKIARIRPQITVILFVLVCSARRAGGGGGKGPERQRSKSLMLSRQTIKEILCCLPACFFFLLFPCHPPRPHLLVLCHINLALEKCGHSDLLSRPRTQFAPAGKFVLAIIEKKLSSLFRKNDAPLSPISVW
jgi:hypothetical protein